MYYGDAPLALDSGLLGNLLGQVDLGELLDPGVVARVGQELQRTATERRVRCVEGVADVLRELGPMGTDEIAMRLVEEEQAAAGDYLEELSRAGRIISVTIAGQDQWAIVEDAARLRDALGVKLPSGLPKAFLQAVTEPLRDLVARYAKRIRSSPRERSRSGLGWCRDRRCRARTASRSGQGAERQFWRGALS